MKLGEFTEEYILEKAKEDYERGKADFLIKPEETALIVVDVLDEFVRPNWSPYWVPEATRQIPKIKKLVETCRELNIPIIYTAYAFHSKGVDVVKTQRLFPNGKKLLPFLGQLFIKESICQEIKPKPDEIVIIKPSYSAFYQTKLEMILRNLGVETVIICGTMTNYCCGATARDAYWRGFQVIFGSDITATDLPEMQEAELKTLRRGFALVLACNEIIDTLKGKNHPR